MELPQQEAPEQKPVLFNLADTNYAGMIRQALADLPFKIQITKCLVSEQVDRPPEVRLKLTISGEKEECLYKIGGTE